MKKLTGTVTPNLEVLLFNSFYSKSIEGYRELAENEFRLSKIADCSLELFWDKVMPGHAPPDEINMMKDPYTNVVSVPNGKALTGTLLHMGIQSVLAGKIVDAEESIEQRFVDDRGRGEVLLTGHVDMIYKNEHGHPEISDIKTVGTKQFKDISGQLVMKPGSYSDHKELKALLQANAYAYIKKELRFTITWVDRGDNDFLQFKIDVYETDEVQFIECLEKLFGVMEAVREYKAGNDKARPCLEGVCMCQYCDHFNKRCLGRDRIDQLGYVP